MPKIGILQGLTEMFCHYRQVEVINDAILVIILRNASMKI